MTQQRAGGPDAVDPASAAGTRRALRGPSDPEAAWARIQTSARRHFLTPSLLLMTFATGLVDALSYLGIGSVFTANMTGNVVLLGFGLAGAGDFSTTRAGLAIAAFALGGILAGRLARTWHHTPFIWFRRMTAIELVLLAVAGGLLVGIPTGLVTPDEPRRFAAIAVLAFAMGLRNATVRRLGFVDIPTTVLTSTITDLAADSRPGGGERRQQAVRIAAIAAMLAGAAVGALLVTVGALLPLIGAELVVLAAAAHQAWTAYRVPRADRPVLGLSDPATDPPAAEPGDGEIAGSEPARPAPSATPPGKAD